MTKSLPVVAIIAISLGTNAIAHAESSPNHGNAKTATTPTADYPLTTCVVTGEELGTMGQPFEYVYKEPGKPDRVIYFCCKMCVKDFEKEPATYLKTLDEAKAKAATK